MQSLFPNLAGYVAMTLTGCGHEVTDASRNFILAKPRSKLPKGWRRAYFLDGPKRVEVHLPPEEWARIISRPREVEVITYVRGAAAKGVANEVLPERHSPPTQRRRTGWRYAFVAETGARVKISREDYLRIVIAQRSSSAAEVAEEAIVAHVSFLTRQAQRDLVERRLQGLRDCYLPKPMVDAGLFNDVPRPFEWAALRVNAVGEVSCESLARAGLLRKSGIADGHGIALSPWADPAHVSFLFPAKVLDDCDLAWAEELERNIRKATKPYLKLLGSDHVAEPAGELGVPGPHNWQVPNGGALRPPPRAYW